MRREKKARGGDKEAKAQLEVIEAGARHCCATASRRARLSAIAEQKADLQGAAADHGQAGALCLQCRGSRGRHRQCPIARVADYAKARGRRQRRYLGGDRGRGRAARRRGEKRRIPRALGLDEAGPRARHPRRLSPARPLTFFTVGPKEARAWTVPRGAKAPQAAGVIHTDFEKGFIRAETIAYADYVACGGEAGARTPASCVSKARIMSCRTATSCISACRTRLFVNERSAKPKARIHCG